MKSQWYTISSLREGNRHVYLNALIWIEYKLLGNWNIQKKFCPTYQFSTLKILKASNDHTIYEPKTDKMYLLIENGENKEVPIQFFKHFC